MRLLGPGPGKAQGPEKSERQALVVLDFIWSPSNWCQLLPFFFFGWEGSPTKIGPQQKKLAPLINLSNLEDVDFIWCRWTEYLTLHHNLVVHTKGPLCLV